MTQDNILKFIIAAALFLGTFITIPKIKLNLWGIIGKLIRDWLFKEVIEKIEHLSKDVADVKKDVSEVNDKVNQLDNRISESEAVQCRTRILRFGDELLHEVEHSKEHFDQTLEDIDDYEDYCQDHPKFENNKAVATIKIIKEAYRDRFYKRDFT